jgi:hypothetical protein
MEEVEHRPEVYKHCGKDIVRFIWCQNNGEKEMVRVIRAALTNSCQVGSVQFKVL